MRVTHYVDTCMAYLLPYMLEFLAVNKIKSARCLAYQNLAGDDYRVVYEIFIDGSNLHPRYIYIANLEYDQILSAEQDMAKSWTHCSQLEILGTLGLHGELQLCFELYEPFGIHYSK